ncbi:DUF2171 domain-containing protein [Devosia naphthalenivorans]|uniref:DUF2171 domain-containing protein n=1 Tax=Devosia naphthalenivorans TaxID=2082392 RepID=UPI000D3D4410|nr:DUF2171 domain-containing protein [Devosia naphthalenivorans]
MDLLSEIVQGMLVIGADGVPVGKVASVEEDRIKLEIVGGGSHGDHSHYIPGGLVAAIENDVVRLSPTGANAVLLDEEKDGSSAD